MGGWGERCVVSVDHLMAMANGTTMCAAKPQVVRGAVVSSSVRRGASRVRTSAGPGAGVAVAPGLGWAAFSARHAGEWSGSKVTFALDTGEVQPLPDVLVPEQFRAWDMQIFDLQHQISCGSPPSPAGDGGEAPLSRRMRTLAPTAGCEADASTVVDDVRDALDPADARLVRFEDGSYALGPTSLAEAHLPGPANEGRGAPFTTEVALLRPGGDAGEAPMRARVVASAHINPEGGLWGRTFAVFLERWQGPWDRSASLDCACGSPLPPWGEKPANRDALAGFPPSDAPTTAVLPNGLSLASWSHPSNGYTLEVGWCIDDATRLFLRRTYDPAGALTACTLDRQTAS